jgi:hypothetical protein
MKKSSIAASILSKIIVPAFALFTLSNCSEEEIAPTVQQAEVAGATTGVKNQEEPVLSITIDGSFTELVSAKDCKTCHYVVPANATTIDGKEIGIKPGQAICLDLAIKYGNLNFINLEGEADKPIIVAYGVNAIANDPVEDTTGEE